ncbi:MAG: hypothetical protein JOZ15_16060 [Acidobacteria bacterium]|nr:hypothetical protein [Acidobacteriota bacterium]
MTLPRERPATLAGPGSLAAADTFRVAAQLPEPGHLWIRFAPRGWQGPDRPWLDLATGRLGRSGSRPPALAPAPSGPPLDDVLYLPPVPAPLAAWRDTLAGRALAGGTPVLAQLLPGDETRLPQPGAAGALGVLGAVVVVDLLPALLPGGALRDDLAGARVPAGARAGAQAGVPAAVPAGAQAAVWPLLPGITDDPELWERSCWRLAAAGLECVQALVPALGPGDRRRLAQGQPEGAFAALFHRQHRQPPPERDFARTAHRHGLAPFLPRPLPRPPLARSENRRIAGQLALAAELSLRLGRPVEQAQSLFRAARWLDATAYDAGALSREGNLGVVTALDSAARRAVAEAAAGREPVLLGELMAEYLGP